MTFDCRDLERALAAPELLPEAREHARVCLAARRELCQLWSEMSIAAAGVREEWESPDLWVAHPSGSGGAAEGGQTARHRLEAAGGHCRRHRGGGVGSHSWRPFGQLPPARQDSDFLTEQTLKEVEQSETAYRASIDKLARLASPS